MFWCGELCESAFQLICANADIECDANNEDVTREYGWDFNTSGGKVDVKHVSLENRWFTSTSMDTLRLANQSDYLVAVTLDEPNDEAFVRFVIKTTSLNNMKKSNYSGYYYDHRNVDAADFVEYSKGK